MENKESDNVIENLNLGKAAVLEYTDLVNTLKHYWEYNAPMKYGEWYFLLNCNHEPIFEMDNPVSYNLTRVLNFDFKLEDIKKKIKKLKTQCAYQLQAKQIGSEHLQKKLKEKERKMFLLMEEIGRALEPEREMMERHKAIKEKNKKDCCEPPQPEPTFDWGTEL